MAQIYKLNADFADKYNFLRVRSSCSVRSDDNVVYKVQTSDLAKVQWQVDENETIKEWFKVVSVDRSDGTRIGGAGWVLKTYEDVVTLVPEMRKYLRPNTPATYDDDWNRSTGRLVRSITDRAAAEGRGRDLDPEWMEKQFSNPRLRRAVFPQGAAAWEYKFDGIHFGRHVRVVMRHGIVTDVGPPGRGVHMAAAVHAAADISECVVPRGHGGGSRPALTQQQQSLGAMIAGAIMGATLAVTCGGGGGSLLGATMLCRSDLGGGCAREAAGVSQFTADVIVFFLEAIPETVKLHQNAGYTALKGVDRGDLTLMYHQERKLGVQTLSEAQVRQLFSEYC